MAHQKLDLWITGRPNHMDYAGTVANAPFIYMSGSEPSTDASEWSVADLFTELPDTNQTPTSVDVTTTGKDARDMINALPDAPSATDSPVPLGSNTDATFESIRELMTAYAASVTAGENFYVANFLGDGKESKVFATSLDWGKSITGNTGDALQTSIAITPRLAIFNDLIKISKVGG